LPSPAGPILVYDGDCAFCSRSVQFILRHDRRRSVRFAARDGVAGRAVRERHPALLQVDSLIWVETRGALERPLVRSESVLAIAAYLGGGFGLLGAVGRLIPRPLRDLGYDVIARFRRRLSFGGTACVIFTPEERSRVLD
jgi:predicted DCC family thiol-disulfide oxidoreductase YuxK